MTLNSDMRNGQNDKDYSSSRSQKKTGMARKMKKLPVKDNGMRNLPVTDEGARAKGKSTIDNTGKKNNSTGSIS